MGTGDQVRGQNVSLGRNIFGGQNNSRDRNISAGSNSSGGQNRSNKKRMWVKSGKLKR